MTDDPAGTAVPLTDQQLERWRGYAEEFQKDPVYPAHLQTLERKRPIARFEMQKTLQRYLNGEMSSQELRAVFQTKTIHEWGVFGLKGIAGAMVVNQLVKQISARELDPQLRSVLVAPSADDEATARTQMEGFYQFVERWRISHGLKKLHIQTTNIPFLVSAWWHIQDWEAWPIFYMTGRNTLQREGLYNPTGKPIADYFAFRTCFRKMQKALDMTPWQFEQLCAWLDRGASGEGAIAVEVDESGSGAAAPDKFSWAVGDLIYSPPGEVRTDTEGNMTVPQAEEITHTQVQWMLAKIGQKLGLRVWIAENDRSRSYGSEKLGALSIGALPNVGLDPETQKTIRLIDVVWIKGSHQLVAAFEVEHTTSVFSGLLRMADLIAVYPSIAFPLYIVAPESRMDLVRRQLRRPVFQGIGLHQRCRFFSDESLLAAYAHIMKWATDPSVIDKHLAQRVGDVQEGEPADWLQDD